MDTKTFRYTTAVIVGTVLLLVIYLWLDNPQKQTELISAKSTPSVEAPIAASQSQNTIVNTESSPVGSTVLDPSPDAVFDSVVVKGKKELSEVIPAPMADRAWRIFQKYKCDSPQLSIYSKEGKAGKLIVSDCHRVIESANEEHDEFLDIEFPIMVSVTANSVHELVNLTGFGFMYESGTLKAVTDINNNNHLELWLEGAICECDGEEDEPCDCTGTRIVEDFNGQLREFQP